MVDGEKRRRLEIDPAAPALSRFSQDWPTDSRLRADAVDMGANGRCPRRVGAAQAELHTRSGVGRAPCGGRVFDRRRDRARKIPDWVSLPPPDMPLVEMGVDVHEERQDDAPGHCEFWRFVEVDGAVGGDLRYDAIFNEHVDDGETVKVEWRDGLRQHAAEDAPPLKHIGSGNGEGELRGYPRERLLPIVQEFRARHFGRRSRPTPLFTNCKV